MKNLLVILTLVILLQQSATAQGLYRTGDTGRNAGRGWYPSKEAENRILSDLKRVDPHSQAASDILWDLADFYENGCLYKQEVDTWKRYITVYEDPRWTQAERLEEQRFAYSALGRAYAETSNFQDAEEAHKKAVELAKLATATGKEKLLQCALFSQCEFYVNVRKPQQALKTYNEFLTSWRKDSWLHPSDLRSRLLALGLPPTAVNEK